MLGYLNQVISRFISHRLVFAQFVFILQQFDNLWLPGFAFKKLENWLYLVASTSSKKIVEIERDSDSDIIDTESSDDLLHQSIDESEGSTTCTTSISEIGNMLEL